MRILVTLLVAAVALTSCEPSSVGGKPEAGSVSRRLDAAALESAGSATFDAARGAPACAAVGSQCDSGSLLAGRAGLGPELHAPNTVGGSCADGTEGTYGSSPSLERLAVIRADGTAFATGKEVMVQATVQASANYVWESLELFAAPDASNPQWKRVATVYPRASGLQVLTARYLLPAGGTQVLRGAYRTGNGGPTGVSAASTDPDPGEAVPVEILYPCVSGPLNDHDDLVFAVGQETDATPPTVAITAPGNGATVGNFVTFGISASDNFGVSRVEVYDGNTRLVSLSGAVSTWTWSSQEAPNGSHTFTARAYDAAGLSSTSAPVTVTLDNDHTPPWVSFLTPAEGAVVSGRVELLASASDDRHVSSISFDVDGTFIDTTYAPRSSVTWYTSGVPNGPHVLGVTAYDDAYNASTRVTVNVTVDNDVTPPQVAFSSPTDGAEVSGVVSLQVSASDNRQVTQVEFFQLDGEVIGGLGTDTTAPFAVSWSSVAVPNGSYTFTSRAYDGAGLSAASAPITVKVNNPGNARYDPVLKAPRCDAVSDHCDSMYLATERAGPEQHSPNTLDGCVDGSGGTYADEVYIHRMRVIREDGTVLMSGKTVRLAVDVLNGQGRASALDLYSAADAAHPSWTYLTTLPVPTSPGLITLAADYVLPVGGVQAVRANLRAAGSSGPCTAGPFDERDDLVFPVQPDPVAPTVSLTAPGSGTTFGGTVTLKASASDNAGVAAVDFLDGQTLIGSASAPPYSVSWDTRGVPEGSHTLTARARDTTGNVATSQPVTVRVDNAAPVVRLTSPAQGATVTGGVLITANATDNEGVTRMELYDGTRLLASESAASITYGWWTKNEPEGAHVLTARAYDAVGNVGSSAQVTVTVVYDTTPPAVSITAPTNGQTFSDHGTVVVRASATDAVGLEKLELFVDGALRDTEYCASQRAWELIGIWDTKAAANGGHTLTVRATDLYGNVATSPAVNVTVDNDLSPPTVSLASPVNGARVSGTVSVRVYASDDRTAFPSLKLFVDGSVSAMGYAYDSPQVFSWDTRSLANGTHTLRVEASDSVNVSTTAPISVTVDNDTVAPTVVLTSPVNGANVGGLVTLRAEASDDKAVTRVDFYVNEVFLLGDVTAPYSVTWKSTSGADGRYTLKARASDAAGNTTTSAGVTVNVSQLGQAELDPVLHVPACATVNNLCDTTTLVKGRAATEPNAPNTLEGCGDGQASADAAPQRIERIKLSRVNGEFFAEGRRARIDVDVVAANTATDALDLFYTSDAAHPSWTYLTTLRPGATGPQVLSAEYVLPVGGLQAVRARFRGEGANGVACGGGSADDADDVAFAVGQPTDAFPPTVALTSPANNARVAGTVTLSATADDDFSVKQVNFYVDGSLISTDTTAPYEVAWNPASVADGTHSLTARAFDPGGRGTTSTAVVVNLDRTPPTAALTSPAPGAFLRGNVLLEATASDNYAVSTVELYDGTTLLGAFSSAPYSMSWNTAGVAEGAHSLTVKATDLHGNVRTTSGVGVTVDNTAPAVAVSAPARNARVRGTVQVSASASDTVGVARVELYADGTLLGSVSSAPYALSWDSGTVMDGVHTLTAKAYDNTGNVRASEGVGVDVDNTLPAVALTSPEQGAFLRGIVVLGATASDNVGVERVELYEGTTLLGTAFTAPYALSWNTVGVADGAHTLTVSAHDLHGNVRTTSGVEVTVDNTVPATAVSAPAQNAFIRGTVQVSATASDNQAVSRVELYVGGTLIGTATTSPYAVSWDTTSGANGGVTLTTRAYDAAGNVTVSAGRAVTVDNAAPTVALTSPANGATLSSLSLSTTIQASASDNAGVTQVVFYDGGSVLGTDTTAPYSVSWNLLSASKGTHTLTARASDAAGNVTVSAPVSVKVN